MAADGFIPIAEPGDGLWAEVSRLTKWPDSDEDTVQAMAAGRRGGGDQFTRASAFDLGISGSSTSGA